MGTLEEDRRESWYSKLLRRSTARSKPGQPTFTKNSNYSVRFTGHYTHNRYS
uniref:Uncharacterized protein n=1 Tax=Anguilla anguilla TaxID=7936 RepID=A0A0E9PP08_ANGAN